MSTEKKRFKISLFWKIFVSIWLANILTIVFSSMIISHNYDAKNHFKHQQEHSIEITETLLALINNQHLNLRNWQRDTKKCSHVRRNKCSLYEPGHWCQRLAGIDTPFQDFSRWRFGKCGCLIMRQAHNYYVSMMTESQFVSVGEFAVSDLV